MKTCPGCGLDKADSEFYRNRCRSDGLSGWCKHCASEWDRSAVGAAAHSRSAAKWRNSEKGRATLQKRRRLTNKQIKAHTAVRSAIRSGALVDAASRNCARCGAAAEHYHHSSYASEDHLNVKALCAPCHKLTHKLEKADAGPQ